MKQNIKLMATVYDETFWRNHVNACKTSECNKSQYCKQHGLSYHRFLYWYNKFAAPFTNDALISVQMQEQAISHVSPPQTILATLVLRSGLQLQIYDVSVVTMILAQGQ